DQQVRQHAALQHRKRLGPAGRFLHAIPALLEDAPFHPPDRRLIIDDQYEGSLSVGHVSSFSRLQRRRLATSGSMLTMFCAARWISWRSERRFSSPAASSRRSSQKPTMMHRWFFRRWMRSDSFAISASDIVFSLEPRVFELEDR